MNLIDRFISYIKKVCNNNETCAMIIFVLVGFMLCFLFKDEISGFDLQGAPLNNTESGNGSRIDTKTRDLPRQQGPTGGSIGIDLLPRGSPEPTPSMERQLKVMAAKPSVTGPPIGQQHRRSAARASLPHPRRGAENSRWQARRA